MEENIKKILFWLSIAILFLPATNNRFLYIRSGNLNGNCKIAKDTNFTISGWFTGSYQSKKELYFNDQTGFRSDMIRLTNQIDYSLFDKCHAVWNIKGKNGCLFQWPYINSYYGLEYQGYENILQKVKKMKAIQDTLKKLNVHFVMAYLPSKADFYPEYFPNDRIFEHPGKTNYDTYKKLCDSLNVTQIDLNGWFVSMKRSAKEPLFSKQGIHWTKYGAILGGDSLTKFIENLTNIHVTHPDWTEIEHTDKLRDGDDDLVKDLNLIFPITRETMAYPHIKEVSNAGERKPNVIYIGDSYAHKMTEFGIIYKLNNVCEFWSYFDEMHDINGHRFAYINNYDWKADMLHCDCIVISYTLFNFWQLGNGFIEQTYDYFYPSGIKN